MIESGSGSRSRHQNVDDPIRSTRMQGPIQKDYFGSRSNYPPQFRQLRKTFKYYVAR
jgi:hypothetical protein